MFAGSTAPTGWLKCNGAAVSRTAYADLFSAIGTTYGAGDSISTFNLPDTRGYFLRGFDSGAGVDSGRTFASTQTANITLHDHTWFRYYNYWTTDAYGQPVQATFIGALSNDPAVSFPNPVADRSTFWNGFGGGAPNTGGSEGSPINAAPVVVSGNRQYQDVYPDNIAILTCIKY